MKFSYYFTCTVVIAGLDKSNHLCARSALGEHPKFYDKKTSEKVSGCFFLEQIQDYINALSRSTLDCVSQISAVNTSWQSVRENNVSWACM